MSVSRLYTACHDGDVKTVEQLLPTLTLKEIDRIEPTVKSTCLHAACYYNHPQIVKLLLDYGASRKIKNKYGNTPSEEAQTKEVKLLFNRPFDDAQKRFLGEIPVEAIEYTCTEYGIYGWRYKERMINKDISKAIDGIMADKRFEDAVSTNKIVNLLAEARENQDPELLVQSYSAGTGFCHVLNQILAVDPIIETESNTKTDLYSFVGVFLRHATLTKYRYIGICYRGMKLSQEDFDKNYQCGQTILIKPFISTSKCRNIAEDFATRTSISSRPLSVLCIITIPDHTRSYDDHVALDISSISDYPDEQEVLILPYTSLQIQRINHLSSRLIEVEMDWFSFSRSYSNLPPTMKSLTEDV